MLADGGGSFPSDHSALHMKAEPILTDFRFGELGANGGFELRIIHGGHGGAVYDGGGFGRRGCTGRQKQRSGQNGQKQASKDSRHRFSSRRRSV
jgi:hypothetical protein